MICNSTQTITIKKIG